MALLPRTAKTKQNRGFPFISHHLASCCKGFKRSWKFVVCSEVPKHKHSLRSTFLITEKFATFPGEISNVNSKGVPALHAYRSFSFLLAKITQSSNFLCTCTTILTRPPKLHENSLQLVIPLHGARRRRRRKNGQKPKRKKSWQKKCASGKER